MKPGARSCLAALLLPVFFAAFAIGTIAAGVGIYDLAAQDRPIKCGDKVMPDDDRHTCFPGGLSYQDLVQERQQQVDNAPDFAVGGGITALVSGAGLFCSWRYGRRTGRA